MNENHDLLIRAERVMPGGVNSPVRAFRAVGNEPLFITHAKGATITSVSGQTLVDFVGSWGPAILGHADPDVLAAIHAVTDKGLSFGAPTALEVDFAETVLKLYPSMEMLRCVSSGTEATMSALRAARGFTGRDVIVKFNGGYHGHSDALLVKAGSGAATFGSPDSSGVPKAMVENTVVARYNDLPALAQLFAQEGERIAAVIVEPVAGNMGCVPPVPGFLQGIIDLCTKHGAISIFDEVMTGCRLAKGGAQEYYACNPDVTCLGKIIGGGMPLAVYGGKRKLMERIAPLGPIYQAGTLSGNPLAVTAGITTLCKLQPEHYAHLETLGARLEAGIAAAIQRGGHAACVQRVGSMITVFFTEGPVRNWEDASRCDTSRFGRFHQQLIRSGIYWPPAQFEAAFLSTAHGTEEVDQAIAAIDLALTASAS